MKKMMKIVAVLYRGILKLVSIISLQKYMDWYTLYLKQRGVQLTGKPKYIAPNSYFDGHDYSLITMSAAMGKPTDTRGR